MKILVVGATGRLGSNILSALWDAEGGTEVEVHALVRNAEKLDATVRKRITEVIEGDGTQSATAQKALALEPDVIVIPVGLGDSRARTTVRTDVTRNILEAMRGVGSTARLIAVSSVGAGDSGSQVGVITRAFLGLMLKHVLADHTEQERLIREQLPEERWLVVRPSSLHDKPAKKSYQVTDTARLRSTSVARADVAHFIATQALQTGDSHFGKMVCITW